MAPQGTWPVIRDRLQKPVWFCIASGPSLTQDDVDLIPREYGVITINTSYRMAPWADVAYGCDRAWWDHENPDVEGVKLSYANTDKTIKVPHERGEGLGRDKIRTGGNSGYQAVNLAYLLGGRIIVMLGYDMQKTNGKDHWHGSHPKPLRNGSSHKVWCDKFKPLAKDLKSEGVRGINATRQTALTCFERMTIESAIHEVRQVLRATS